MKLGGRHHADGKRSVATGDRGGARPRATWRGSNFERLSLGWKASAAGIAGVLVLAAPQPGRASAECVRLPDPQDSGAAVCSPGGANPSAPTEPATETPAATAPPVGPDEESRPLYDVFRPLAVAAPVAEVPSFAERAGSGRAWGFESWGSPDAARPSARAGERVTSIAVSADGASGWAIGPATPTGQLTLHRFDGSGWRRCDAGDPAGGDADPACAGLADLRARGLVLEAIATTRRPDDAFETAAVGWLPAGAGQPVDTVTAVIVHYRRGRWRIEDVPNDPVAGRAYKLRSVAFDNSGEGWAYGHPRNSTQHVVMLRYRDGTWTRCVSGGSCGDVGALPETRFVPPAHGPALVGAGDRVFFAGTRLVFNSKLPEKRYPVILSTDGGPWDVAYGFDPAGPGNSPDSAEQGEITSFAVGVDGAGISGWARVARSGGNSTDTLRLSTGRWKPWSATSRDDALRDHPAGAELLASTGGAAFMSTRDGPLLRFDADQERWRVLPAPFDPSGANPFTAAAVQAAGPDGRGGLWLVQDGGQKGPFFHRYTARPRRPVFEDVPQPFAGARIRHLAASPDGTVWIAGAGAILGRYDRLTGWSLHRIVRWTDSEVTALAAGSDGTGIAVGKDGRIATLGRDGGELDDSWCPPDTRSSCRIGATWNAADIAEDGSAAVAGSEPTLAWRPADGEFRTIEPPSIDASERITAVALAAEDRMWATTSKGTIFAGRRSADGWTWNQERPRPQAGTQATALHAIDIRSDGRGYAAGDAGTLLERAGDGTWRQVPLGVSDNFTTLAVGDGGVLVGADDGAVWTRRAGQFRIARPGSTVDRYAAYGGTTVTGVAIVPGYEAGQVEAWAAIDGPSLGGVLLHYSNSEEPLLSPVDRISPLPDSPSPRPSELSFVAFGKSDCANAAPNRCPGPSGTDALSDVISQRIVDEVRARVSRNRRRPAFALFTGDANDHGGDLISPSRPAVLNAWVDLVARPLDATGVPALGAIGVLDLTEAAKCVERNLGVCVNSTSVTQTGANFFWRQAMAGRVGQDDGPRSFAGLRYEPVHDDLVPAGVNVQGERVLDSLPLGRARTHYAVDVMLKDRPLARLVFVDNSLGSLRASDPLQHPPEPRGQLAWLDQVLGSRAPSAPAVVIATSPSYTNAPETAAGIADDGTSFEEVVLKHRVSAVVSGRLGWNGLYYTLAPGLHCPSPGGAYPEHPPTSADGCGGASRLPPLAAAHHRTAVPFIVSASAGGKLAEPEGEGYWHGYAEIRVDASGDPTRTVVVQRPILDWLVLTGPKRLLSPGQTMSLTGVGREPAAADTPPRYHRIATPSITHRYDLLLADPQRPWLPARDGDGYVQLSDRHPECRVACIHRQSGEISTGAGVSERVYAIAALSAGELSATYPLVFEAGGRRALAVRSGAGEGAAARGSRPGLFTDAPAGRESSSENSPDPHSPVSASSVAPAPGSRPSAPPAPPFRFPSATTHAWLGPSGSGPARAPPLLLDPPPKVSPVPPNASPAHPAAQVNRRHARRQLPDPVLAELEDPNSLVEETQSAELQDAGMWVDLADAPSAARGAEATRRTPLRPDLPLTALPRPTQPSAWASTAIWSGSLIAVSACVGCGLGLWRRRVAVAPARAASRSAEISRG